MSTALGDPPRSGAETVEDEQSALASGPQTQTRSCTHCGSPLATDQDWCLQCGAGAPGSIERPRWRSTGAITAAVAVLALGAAVAAYAAMNQHSPKRATVTKTVAVATLPSTLTPATKLPPPAKLGKAGKLPPPLKTKLPKIPLTALTPKTTKPASKTTTTTSGSGTKTSSSSETGTKETTGGGESSGAEPNEPTALLLDTNAASTYNPYGLPAAYFGDPSLAIDGDPATAWTAQVDPATAPNMLDGVLLNLKKSQKVGSVKLNTQTPGMTVQVYGTAAAQVPDTILAARWVPLSAQLVVSKRSTQIKLRHQSSGFRYVLLWISKAPAADVGTAQAPGHVAVNELELFPPSSG